MDNLEQRVHWEQNHQLVVGILAWAWLVLQGLLEGIPLGLEGIQVLLQGL